MGRLGCLDEYQKFVNGMNTPRVAIDNGVCATATLVKVDSVREHSILLKTLQLLTHLNLKINKAYVSSDGGQWFMDVFYVTDHLGFKLTDPSVLAIIEPSLATAETNCSVSEPFAGLTTLEVTGSDRPGLLSEVFAVLRDLNCDVVEAKVWTHNGRIAGLIFVKDFNTGMTITDSSRIASIEARLRYVLKGDDEFRDAKITVAYHSVVHADRRLHQLMFDDCDYECVPDAVGVVRPSVSVQDWMERGYSIVSVQCKSRPKLLFDTVCTLTDMQYVVYHGTVDTFGDREYQEFYIRHSDGTPISSEAERQRLIQCLQAAIERRVSEGLRLELVAMDRKGLLADVTRTFREDGLSVTRADVTTTKYGMANNVFYVTDTAGNPPDPRIINAVIDRIGVESLKVNVEQLSRPWHNQLAGKDGSGAGFNLGNLVKKNLSYLGLIKSCS